MIWNPASDFENSNWRRKKQIARLIFVFLPAAATPSHCWGPSVCSSRLAFRPPPPIPGHPRLTRDFWPAGGQLYCRGWGPWLLLARWPTLANWLTLGLARCNCASATVKRRKCWCKREEIWFSEGEKSLLWLACILTGGSLTKIQAGCNLPSPLKSWTDSRQPTYLKLAGTETKWKRP